MTTRSKSDTVQIHFYAVGSRKFVGNLGNVVYITFALAEYGGLPKMWQTNISPYVTLSIFVCLQRKRVWNQYEKIKIS